MFATCKELLVLPRVGAHSDSFSSILYDYQIPNSWISFYLSFGSIAHVLHPHYISMKCTRCSAGCRLCRKESVINYHSPLFNYWITGPLKKDQQKKKLTWQIRSWTCCVDLQSQRKQEDEAEEPHGAVIMQILPDRTQGFVENGSLGLGQQGRAVSRSMRPLYFRETACSLWQ